MFLEKPTFIIDEKKRKIEQTGLDIARCLTYNPVQSYI